MSYQFFFEFEFFFFFQPLTGFFPSWIRFMFQGIFDIFFFGSFCWKRQPTFSFSFSLSPSLSLPRRHKSSIKTGYNIFHVFLGATVALFVCFHGVTWPARRDWPPCKIRFQVFWKYPPPLAPPPRRAAAIWSLFQIEMEPIWQQSMAWSQIRNAPFNCTELDWIFTSGFFWTQWNHYPLHSKQLTYLIIQYAK